ncbi:hypothetical protein RJO15_19860 [Herbaspirillum huttiense F1]|uniref:DUF6708 domain-containing protein n=1 Tax=Herbaspirillum sp. 1130 TaxID=2806562 RepID=UPI0010E0890A|nr:DUF6708 domain-containing protein [Herbaspirillum sp. 1130]MDT0358053.1 hypothetical protein [Herbaspirillum huttiense F1]
MSVQRGSRFIPQNSRWYEDLVPRESPSGGVVELNSVLLDEDLNHVDERYLEFSRASSFMRGGGMLVGTIVLSILGFLLIPALIESGSGFFTRNPVLGALTCVIIFACLVGALVLMLYDFLLPRDMPVRFNRRTQKVYFYECQTYKRRITAWHKVVKVYDWNCIEAEIARIAGYTGKAYVVRHQLILVVCKPGTNEVIDRLLLKGLDPTVATLYQLWAYIRLFMKDGTGNLPKLEARPQEQGFAYSLFNYMPYLSPTETGRRFRQKMQWVDYLLAIMMVWLFWIWLPLGFCHYVASQCAPDPKWPADIDAESRSL